MFYIEKPRNTNGVVLTGDFFDFDRLYFAIMKFTGFYGRDGRCIFPGCDQVCENLLGLCYEIRHAWQGDRNIVQVYSGIHEYWFDDYVESDTGQYEQDYDEDDEYGFDDDDSDNDESVNLNIGVFSRKDFPDANEQNTYFSVALPFPEVIFYALVLSDLLKKKEIFMLSVEKSAKIEGMLQELNKEYFYFDAECDIARLSILVKQALNALYQFVGEEEYLAFMGQFEQINDFSANCNLEKINNLIVDYCEKEYEIDETKTLMNTLIEFLK